MGHLQHKGPYLSAPSCDLILQVPDIERLAFGARVLFAVVAHGQERAHWHDTQLTEQQGDREKRPDISNVIQRYHLGCVRKKWLIQQT